MPKFYNKTRGPLSFSSRDGSPLFVGPKSFIDVETGDLTSEVLAAQASGDLVRVQEDPLPLEDVDGKEGALGASVELPAPVPLPVPSKPLVAFAKEVDPKESVSETDSKDASKKPVESRRAPRE